MLMMLTAGQTSSVAAQYWPSAQQNQSYSPTQQPVGQSVPSQEAAPFITFLDLAFMLASFIIFGAGQSSSVAAQYWPSAQQNQSYSPTQQPVGQSVPSQEAAPFITFLDLAFMPH